MTAEMMQRCSANFCWPLSVSRTFNSQLVGCNVDDGAADTVIYDELMHRVIQEVHQVQGLFFKLIAAHLELCSFVLVVRKIVWYALRHSRCKSCICTA